MLNLVDLVKGFFGLVKTLPQIFLLFFFLKLSLVAMLTFVVYKYFTKNKLVLLLTAVFMAYLLFV